MTVDAKVEAVRIPTTGPDQQSAPKLDTPLKVNRVSTAFLKTPITPVEVPEDSNNPTIVADMVRAVQRNVLSEAEQAEYDRVNKLPNKIIPSGTTPQRVQEEGETEIPLPEDNNK